MSCLCTEPQADASQANEVTARQFHRNFMVRLVQRVFAFADAAAEVALVGWDGLEWDNELVQVLEEVGPGEQRDLRASGGFIVVADAILAVVSLVGVGERTVALACRRTQYAELTGVLGGCYFESRWCAQFLVSAPSKCTA